MLNDASLGPIASSTKTHCPYCALQCGMRMTWNDGEGVITGDAQFLTNRGQLCVKGWSAASTLRHVERLTRPLVRNARGVLAPCDWTVAWEHCAKAFSSIRCSHGPSANAVLGSGALTNEKAYWLGKFARVALQTPHIDYNGRFCMSSAAAACNLAFGIDRGLPFPLEDLAGAELIVMVGCNLAETMPPIMQHFDAQRANGGKVIVIDPRQTLSAKDGDLHLGLVPGTDAAVANGLLHILMRDGSLDWAYIRQRTEGFEKLGPTLAKYWPERTERITGVSEAKLTIAARMLAEARSVVILTGRGPEQQAHGVANTLAFINLALALGMPGKAHSGFGCITGQGNGQGGREHGQKADQLPGYRSIEDPTARRHIARIWGVHENEIPVAGRSAYEILDSIGQADGIRGLLVMGTNPVVSAPNATHVINRLEELDFLAVADFFLSETAALADVVFPSAQWAEEDGTITNLEGRVLLRRKVVPVPDGVRSDLEILAGLASCLGKGKLFVSCRPQDIFEELRQATAGGRADYFGITYDRLAQDGGIFWPCPDEAHPGTPRMFAESFSTPNGRARFHAVDHASPSDDIDSAYPLYLTTGRALAHYQSGNQTRRVPTLVALAPDAYVEIHPSTARDYGVDEGDCVVLRSRRASARFRVKFSSAIRQDTLFCPFHWGGDASINRVTSAALDPISRMPEFKVCAVRLERACHTERE